MYINLSVCYSFSTNLGKPQKKVLFLMAIGLAIMGGGGGGSEIIHTP